METYCSVLVISLIAVSSGHNVDALGPTHESALATYSLPEARELKMALGFNEDTYLNFTELTSKYGYPSEEHTVTTEDGYILTIFRILSKCNESESKLYPVLLMHGIIDTSDLWILPGEDYGFGYVLARNCYDVWVGNHRGNVYSRRHITLDPDKDVEFWEYSFDEHGNYDVPALIDYILYATNKPKVFYAGHSQGTTDFFVLTSLKPEYNKKVQLSIHVGPVAWMTNAFLPLVRPILPKINEIREFLNAAGFRELLARNHIIHFILELLCQLSPEATCGNTLFLSSGYQQGTIRREVLAIAFGHLLSGTSVKSLVHYSQLVLSNKFKRFDEGLQGNKRRYGSHKPPEYDVSRITSPVVLVSAYNDWLSSLKDVKKLSSKLGNLIENYVVPIREWSHHNHLWDERAKVYVIPKLLNYFDRYNY